MELVEVEDDEAEASTVLDELDDDLVDRLLVDVLAEDVLPLLDVLDEDPDSSIVEDEEELVAVLDEEDEVEAEDVLDVLPVEWLDHDSVDALDVEVLDEDFSTIVELVVELDSDDGEEVEVEEVEEVDSDEADFVEDEDELDIETSAVELLLVDDELSSSSTISVIASRDGGRNCPTPATISRIVIADTAALSVDTS